LPLPFAYAENAFVSRTIDTYIQAVQDKPRFISSKKGKNPPQSLEFLIGIFLFKIQIACRKKFKQYVTISLYYSDNISKNSSNGININRMILYMK
jgi:hypothetical protein